MKEKTVETALVDFIALRDKRSELKKQFEEADKVLKLTQDKIEAWVLNYANETGMDSFSIKGVGTAYRRTRLKPQIVDFDRFMDFVSENRAYDAVQKRVNTSFVEAFMEEHNGTAPDGVNAIREYEIVIRRS